MNVTVAGAPVSFGVFEMTPEGADVVAPDDMLAIVAESGYAGVDLGPVGYLGRGAELRRRLTEFDLELAGGWIQLPFSDDDAFRASLPILEDALRVFSDAADQSPSRLPLPTLADDGSARRRANPGRGTDVDPLDRGRRERLHSNTARAADLVRAAGFEPTFHHHAGTFVESPAEIDAFLAEVDMGLTLDTGHLAMAGGDPVDAIRRWGRRINHLHLKDVDVAELQRVLRTGGGMREVWSSGAFVAFGDGDVDVPGVLAEIAGIEYDGWLVVEQDTLPANDIPLDRFRSDRARDQRLNRDALRRWVP